MSIIENLDIDLQIEFCKKLKLKDLIKLELLNKNTKKILQKIGKHIEYKELKFKDFDQLHFIIRNKIKIKTLKMTYDIGGNYNYSGKLNENNFVFWISLYKIIEDLKVENFCFEDFSTTKKRLIELKNQNIIINIYNFKKFNLQTKNVIFNKNVIIEHMNFNFNRDIKSYNEFRKIYHFNKFIANIYSEENLNNYMSKNFIFEEFYFNITFFLVESLDNLKNLVKFINSNIKLNYLYVNEKLLESLNSNHKCINNICLNHLSLDYLDLDLEKHNVFTKTIYIEKLSLSKVTFNHKFKSIIKNISKTCPNIKELNIFTNDNLNYEDLKYLKYIKNLKVITLLFYNSNYINIVFETLDYLLSKNLILEKIVLNANYYLDRKNYENYDKEGFFEEFSNVTFEDCEKIIEYSKLKTYAKNIIFIFRDYDYSENLLNTKFL